VPGGGELHPDLMLSSRLEFQLHQGEFPVRFQRPPMGNGPLGIALRSATLRSAAFSHLVHLAGAVHGQKRVKDALPLHAPFRDGQVTPLANELVPIIHKEFLEAGVFCEEHQAGGLTVYAVHQGGVHFGVAAT
jgi:hypothetical protein